MSVTSAVKSRCSEIVELLADWEYASADDFLASLDVDPDSFEALIALHDYLESTRLKLAGKLISENGGDAIGLELSNSQDQLAVVLPEPSAKGGIRLSFYGTNGPTSHTVHASGFDAVCEAIQQRYGLPTPGRLDALTELPSWERGVRFTALLQKTNGNPWAFLEANPGYLD